MQSDSSEFVSKMILQSFLDEHYGHHYLEDPPENLFTENVTNSFGNNTVCGGNFEQGSFTLNTIISAIHFNIDAFPNGFFRVINDAFNIMLALSNSIAQQVGHTRNMYGEHEGARSEIEFPEDIEQFKEALFFSNEWIEKFCNQFKIDSSILTHFILSQKERNNSTNEMGDRNNPLIVKPIAKLSTGYLIVSPSSIISALIHFVWTQSNECDCQKAMIQLFHKTVWKELKFMINKLRYTREDFKFENDIELPIRNVLFRLDTDKLVYLSFIYDEGEEYSFQTPCHPDPMLRSNLVDQIQNRNFELVKGTYTDYKLIDLVLYSTIGREYLLSFPVRNESAHTLVSSVFKFLCWTKSEEHDQMSLWYFLEARNKLFGSLASRMPIDFLCYYYLYRRGMSFYVSDEQNLMASYLLTEF